MFTNYALQTLFPDWEAYPEHARRISMAHLGLHLDPAEALSPEDTEVKDVVKVSDEPDAAPLNITDIGVSVSSADDTTAKVTVVVEIPDDLDDPRSVLRGKTIREIGLFVNIGTEAVPDWKMVWLSDLPAMYVPTIDETGIAVSFTITVPIRFNNASQISLTTDNDSLAARIGELETEVGGLATRIGELETEVGGLDNRLADAEGNITEISNWKDTVQPQINAINRQMGWNGGYNSKDVFDLTYDVFDPDVASAMSGGYYGGYEFYSPQILGSNSVEFFEVEINNKISGHRPFYSRAILRIETDANGEVTYKGVQQLDKGTNTTGVIGIGRCQDSSFTMLFSLKGGSVPIATSDIPDIQDYYCRIRKLDNSLYS